MNVLITPITTTNTNFQCLPSRFCSTSMWIESRALAWKQKVSPTSPNSTLISFQITTCFTLELKLRARACNYREIVLHLTMFELKLTVVGGCPSLSKSKPTLVKVRYEKGNCTLINAVQRFKG